MGEPGPPVEHLSPDAARAELAATRDHAGLYDVTHPEHGPLTQRMNALTARVQGEPASTAPASPPAPPAAPAPEDDLAEKLATVEGPHAEPRTAAELEAVPLLGGLDPGMSQAVNVAAEREGVTAFVLEGRHVVAGALSGPPVDAVAAERMLQQRWGSRFPSKLEAAHLALDTLPAGVRADLEHRDLDVHPEVLVYLARVGEALLDPTTPGGERRLKERYREWAASQTR